MKLKLLSLFFLAGFLAAAGEPAFYANALDGEDALKGWWIAPGTGARTVAGTGVEIVTGQEAKGKFQGIIRSLPVKGAQGKLLRVSVEAKAEGLNLIGNSKTAGKFMLVIRTPGETFYPQNNPLPGTYDWTPYAFEFRIPASADKLDITLGAEHGAGKILFRDLKLEPVLTEAERHNAHYFDPLLQPDALKGWWVAPGTQAKSVPGTGIEISDGPEAKGKFQGIVRGISAKPLLGKRVKVSVEVKADGVKPAGETATGGKFMFVVSTPGQVFYPQNNPKTGTYDWTPYELEYTVPVDTTALDFTLGLERGSGKILYRNLKLEVLDTLLDLSLLMNMGYADDAANNGKGGWSDQGPDNDAAKFDFTAKRYADIPFAVVNPAENGGKSVMTFQSSNFLGGLPEAVLDFTGRSVSGRHLYLLHTMTWGTKDLAGAIEVTGKNGKTQTVEIRGGRDVNDWWMASPGPNAHPASVWTNASGGIVGIFVSAFPLNGEIGEIASLRFVPKSPTAVWIVLAATLSDRKYEFPETQLETTKENADWKIFPFPEKAGIIPGSALDRGTAEREPAGASGRVVINRDGLFAFEKNPEQPVRFFAALFPNGYIQPGMKPRYTNSLYAVPGQDHKGVIRDMVKSYRHKGYNMFRMHGIEGELSLKNGLDFPEDVFDYFFWTIKCMKDEGIYLNLDVAASSLGFYPGIQWDNSTWRKDHKDAKKHIMFDQDSRENWLAGAKKMLLTVNPYTNTRLIDDPVLACLIGFNEQEFVFSTPRERPEAMPRWKEFLKAKYGTPEKLAAAWGVKPEWKSFDDLPVFRGSLMMETNQTGRDAFDFTRMMEREMFDFYESNLRELGWKGPITNYNMGKSIQYIMAREPAGFVAMNSYHAHPTNYIQPGSTIDQSSSISGAANVARGFYSTQTPGKPFVITEHGHVFWNRHRYEMAFVTDGYGALQGIDGITSFIGQEFAVHGKNHPFGGFFDPVMHASEFLAYYLYARGDVRPADVSFRVVLDEADVLKNHAYRWGVGTGQTRLALLGKFSVEPTPDGKPVFPARQNEVMLRRTGGSAVLVSALGTAGFTSIVDEGEQSAFDFDALVGDLKKRGLIPAGNRTDSAKGLFESQTGELFLDSNKAFMSIDTKRLQGVCALAGTKAKLSGFEILDMTKNGNLAAVSVDDAPDLESSRRIVVVYATDALNTGMVFNDSSRRVMQKLGKLPVLSETGRFSVALNNKNAEKLKAFAVDLNGRRQAELPVKAENGRLLLDVDTATLPGGPAVFFEIAEK